MRNHPQAGQFPKDHFGFWPIGWIENDEEILEINDLFYRLEDDNMESKSILYIPRTIIFDTKIKDNYTKILIITEREPDPFLFEYRGTEWDCFDPDYYSEFDLEYFINSIKKKDLSFGYDYRLHKTDSILEDLSITRELFQKNPNKYEIKIH